MSMARTDIFPEKGWKETSYCMGGDGELEISTGVRDTLSGGREEANDDDSSAI